MNEDPARRHALWFAALAKAAPDVRPASFEYFAANWSRFAQDISTQYELTIYDYHNSLDTRTIIQETLDVLDEHSRGEYERQLSRTDEEFRAATWESDKRWSSSACDGDWWASRLPLRCGDELRHDLEERGIEL